MGKIKTEGRVTLEFDPDLYEIAVSVRAEGKTSGAAVTAGKKQTEQLLESLQDTLHIKPEQITAEAEDVSVPYNQECYQYSRTLMLKIPADNRLREAVTGLLSEMDHVTYSIGAKLADESKYQQAALDAAVEHARNKAEHLAAPMHCRVAGFEEICTDGMSFDACRDTVAAGAGLRMAKSLAADLQNPKIKSSGSVSIVWLTEPLE